MEEPGDVDSNPAERAQEEHSAGRSPWRSEGQYRRPMRDDGRADGKNRGRRTGRTKFGDRQTSSGSGESSTLEHSASRMDVGGRTPAVINIVRGAAGVGNPGQDHGAQVLPGSIDWWERNDVQHFRMTGFGVSGLLGATWWYAFSFRAKV